MAGDAEAVTVRFHFETDDNPLHDLDLRTIQPLATTIEVHRVEVKEVPSPLSPSQRGACPHIWLCNREMDGGFRYLVLFAAFCTCFALGFTYTTAIFVVPVGDEFGVGRSISAVASSSGFLCFALSCTAAGRLAEYFGPQPVGRCCICVCSRVHAVDVCGYGSVLARSIRSLVHTQRVCGDLLSGWVSWSGLRIHLHGSCSCLGPADFVAGCAGDHS